MSVPPALVTACVESNELVRVKPPEITTRPCGSTPTPSASSLPVPPPEKAQVKADTAAATRRGATMM